MSFRYLLTVSSLASLLMVPAIASAQPYAPYPAPAGPGPHASYYATTPPPPPPVRQGLTFGVGAGLGTMESNSGPIECVDCEDSVSGSLDAHIGYMLSPRLAVSFEVWGSGQALDSDAGATLVQALVMGSVQLWVTPRLWIKGGLGTAHLSMRFSDDTADELDTGAAAMAAVGYELIHSPHFSLDVQLRGGAGSYDVIDDRITQGTLQLGVNWF